MSSSKRSSNAKKGGFVSLLLQRRFKALAESDRVSHPAILGQIDLNSDSEEGQAPNIIQAAPVGRPRKTRGRRREDTGALGRYPFLAAARKYLEMRRGVIGEDTWREEERKLVYLNGVFEGMKDRGDISSTDPHVISRGDIQQFLIWMGEKQLEGATQAKYLRYVNKVLLMVRNTTIEDMKLLERGNMPRAMKKEITHLEPEVVAKIQKAAAAVEGWHGVVGQFLMWLYPNTGIRPGELRRAHLEDLDVKKWRFYVRHPKGEKKYGVKRTVPILPPARAVVARYLMERDKYLDENGVGAHAALIPNLRGKDGFYSPKTLRMIKGKVQRLVGVNFKLKDFRPTWAQSCKDRDIDIEAVSKMMGHASTATTERYYARIQDEKAFKTFEHAFDATGCNVDQSESKKAFIDRRNYNAGYA